MMGFFGWPTSAADRRFDEQLQRIVQGRPLDGLEPADAGERGELAAARVLSAELAARWTAPADARARVWGAVRARIGGEVEARRPRAGRWPRPAFGWSLCGVAAAVAVIAVLTAVAAWPAVAAALPRLAPREVVAPPPARVGVGGEDRRFGFQQMEPQEEVERAVGFRLLVPAYLPPGCDELQGRFDLRVPLRHAAQLNYPCVMIREQLGPAEGEQDRPMAAPGAVEELTIGGEPAFYVDGTWWQHLGQPDEPVQAVWKPGLYPTLYLTRRGLFIMITNRSAPIPPIVRMVPGNPASKEEMIRIAASLR